MLTQSIAFFANYKSWIAPKVHIGYGFHVQRPKISKRKVLPKRECGVGLRLREAREVLRLSQKEFANQLGITRQRLASYEELRAPLRFDLALKICRQFVISEKYLATGQGAPRACYDLATEGMAYQLPLDTPFGQAYDKLLGKIYEEIKAKNKGLIPFNLQPGDNLELIKNWLLFVVEIWFGFAKGEKMPKDFEAHLFNFLIANGNTFVEFAVKYKRLPTDDDFKVLIQSSPQKD